MKNIILILVSTAFLGACGQLSIMGYYASLTAENLKKEDTKELCSDYRNFGSMSGAGDTFSNRALSVEQTNIIRNELIRRKVMNMVESVYVLGGLMQVGMSETTLRCGLGRPSDVNISDYGHSIHKQYIYGDDYIYTEDGVITAIQR